MCACVCTPEEETTKLRKRNGARNTLNTVHNQFSVHNVDQLMLKYTDYCWARPFKEIQICEKSIWAFLFALSCLTPLISFGWWSWAMWRCFCCYCRCCSRLAYEATRLKFDQKLIFTNHYLNDDLCHVRILFISFELSLRISDFCSSSISLSFIPLFRQTVVVMVTHSQPPKLDGNKKNSPDWTFMEKTILPNLIEMDKKNTICMRRSCWVAQSNRISAIDKLVWVRKFPFQIKTNTILWQNDSNHMRNRSEWERERKNNTFEVAFMIQSHKP